METFKQSKVKRCKDNMTHVIKIISENSNRCTLMILLSHVLLFFFLFFFIYSFIYLFIFLFFFFVKSHPKVTFDVIICTRYTIFAIRECTCSEKITN